MSFKKLLLASVDVFKITVAFSCAKAAAIQYEVSVSLLLLIEQSPFLMYCSLLC